MLSIPSSPSHSTSSVASPHHLQSTFAHPAAAFDALPPLLSPLPHQPSSASPPTLFRRKTHPIAALPLLNLAELPSHFANPDDICTARRRVENIGTSLSRFRPYLYVGGEPSARDSHALRKAGITHIVNVAGPRMHNFHLDFKYLSLSPRDDEQENIAQYFDLVTAFIDSARRANGSVAILCRQGISRSATLAIAYVLTTESVSLEDALRDLRASRPIVAPNAGFMDQLSQLENRVCHGYSRNWVGSVEPVRKERPDSPYIAKATDGLLALTASHALVMERERWGGVVAWRGRCVSDLVWKKTLAIAERLLQRQEDHMRRSRHWSAAKRASCGRCVEVFMQGECQRTENEIASVSIS